MWPLSPTPWTPLPEVRVGPTGLSTGKEGEKQISSQIRRGLALFIMSTVWEGTEGPGEGAQHAYGENLKRIFVWTKELYVPLPVGVSHTPGSNGPVALVVLTHISTPLFSQLLDHDSFINPDAYTVQAMSTHERAKVRMRGNWRAWWEWLFSSSWWLPWEQCITRYANF